MKILMLNTKMSIGGAETHILTLSRALKVRGHTVTVGSAGGAFSASAEKDGIGTVYLPLDDRKNLFRAVSALKEHLKRHPYDVIHAHGRLPALAASLALKNNERNIPLVTTAHLNFRTDPLLRRVTVWGERTLAVSSSVRDYLLTGYGLPRGSVENTVNGVDTDLFRPGKPDEALLSALGLAGNGETRAIMVSRLDKNADAGVHTVLDALPEILKALPRFELILCGGGDDEAAVREKAEEINRAAGRKAVILTGPRTDIPALVKLASVGLGVSRAAMEEMACGKPVILIGPQGYLGIFDETKEKEAAETNFCCMNALPAPKTLAEEIVKLFSLPQSERARLGAENRRLIEREYSVGRMADDAERLYRIVVKSDAEGGTTAISGDRETEKPGFHDGAAFRGTGEVEKHESYEGTAFRGTGEVGKPDSYEGAALLTGKEDPVWIGYLRKKYGIPGKNAVFVFPRKNGSPSLLSAVRALAEHGKTPVIVPPGTGSDRKAAKTLQKRAGGILLDAGMTGKELVGLTEGAEAVITERYRGLVCAIRAGIPAVPISDDPKTAALCSGAGLPSPLPPGTADARAILSALKNARAGSAE